MDIVQFALKIFVKNSKKIGRGSINEMLYWASILGIDKGGVSAIEIYSRLSPYYRYFISI